MPEHDSRHEGMSYWPSGHDSKHEELDYKPSAPGESKCYNVRGSSRCDVCFGPLPGTHPTPYDTTPSAEQGPPPTPTVRAGLHPTTFEYLKPSDEQMRIMNMLRFAAKVYSEAIENFVPDGPDKTFILRQHRQNAMWVNVAITRLADGTPRP